MSYDSFITLVVKQIPTPNEPERRWELLEVRNSLGEYCSLSPCRYFNEDQIQSARGEELQIDISIEAVAEVNSFAPEVWYVWKNTDQTEGKGRSYVWKVCDIEATARRLAKKEGTMGSDAHISRGRVFRYKSNWYGIVHLEEASAADKNDQEKIEKRRAAVEKAKAAGLTEQELLDMGVYCL